MNNIDQFLRWDPTPLASLTALGLSRVLEPLDPERSTKLRNHAQDNAVAIGEYVKDPDQIPALIADEEWLVRGFIYGCEQAAEAAEETERQQRHVG